MSHSLVIDASIGESQNTNNDGLAMTPSIVSISGVDKECAPQENPVEAKRLQDVDHYKSLVRARFTELTTLLKDCDTKESVKNACLRYAVLEKMEQLRQRIMVALWTFTPDIREAEQVHALEPAYLSFVFDESELQRYMLFNETIKEYQFQQHANVEKVISRYSRMH